MRAYHWHLGLELAPSREPVRERREFEQPKKKAFRTIRKEITLRAADLATAARGASREMWWAARAPGFMGATLRASLEDTAADFWIYDDLKAAEKQAKKEAKPLLISFRCVP